MYPSGRGIFSLADGCSWGRRPQEAAKKASHAFMEYLTQHLNDIVDIRDAGHFLLRAFDKASREIVQGKDDIWDAGTTTLLGGLLLELEDDKEKEEEEGEVGAEEETSMMAMDSREERGEGENMVLINSKSGAKKSKREKRRRYGFVCANVGDCKVNRIE